MKNKIFMYLFIFTFLIALFVFMDSKAIIEDYDKNLRRVVANEQVYKDSLAVLTTQLDDVSFFNLSKSQDALNYFDREGIDGIKLEPVIKDALYSMNEYKSADHPLIPFAGTGGKKLVFNTIRVLNHKWIIADFSDGTIWGEMLIYYSLDKNNDLRFKALDQLLYPLN